ncbi:hypothetical protein P4O66_014941 [Electrophorus voltai]|uniref:Uncharacterized protein n=1 Tax=Electrophorus voltai TaxID=2609070 RepID=A0AAD8YXP5_9TELE|nr:hypothetical protein P4O66_014941 [Electrophorus voltai]
MLNEILITQPDRCERQRSAEAGASRGPEKERETHQRLRDCTCDGCVGVCGRYVWGWGEGGMESGERLATPTPTPGLHQIGSLPFYITKPSKQERYPVLHLRHSQAEMGRRQNEKLALLLPSRGHLLYRKMSVLMDSGMTGTNDASCSGKARRRPGRGNDPDFTRVEPPFTSSSSSFSSSSRAS